MEATLYDCYICKAEGTYGVCPSCLTTLSEAASIKKETCDCNSIEEICSCLDTRSSLHSPATPVHIEFCAEFLEDHNHEGERVVKISPTSTTEWLIYTEFIAWLYQYLLSLTTNK